MKPGSGLTGRTRRALATVASVTLVAGLSVAGTVASQSANAVTPAFSSQVLQLPNVKVVSSTGAKLSLGLELVDVPAYPTLSGLIVYVGQRGRDGEQVQWHFPTGTSTSDAIKLGAGSVTVPKSKLGPFGKIDLKLKPQGQPTSHACDASNYTASQRESVKGTLVFNTGTTGKHSWGKVGKKSVTFTADNATYGYSVGTCQTPDPVTKCTPFLEWYDDRSTGVTVSGGWDTVGGRKAGYVSADHTQTLDAPSGATRTDDVRLATPVPTVTQLADGRRVVHIKTDGGGAFGSATITATTPPAENSFACKGGTGGEQAFNAAQIRNGKKTLGVTSLFFGKLKLKNSSNGSFYISTTLPG